MSALACSRQNLDPARILACLRTTSTADLIRIRRVAVRHNPEADVDPDNRFHSAVGAAEEGSVAAARHTAALHRIAAEEARRSSVDLRIGVDLVAGEGTGQACAADVAAEEARMIADRPSCKMKLGRMIAGRQTVTRRKVVRCGFVGGEYSAGRMMGYCYVAGVLIRQKRMMVVLEVGTMLVVQSHCTTRLDLRLSSRSFGPMSDRLHQTCSPHRP